MQSEGLELFKSEIKKPRTAGEVARMGEGERMEDGWGRGDGNWMQFKGDGLNDDDEVFKTEQISYSEEEPEEHKDELGISYMIGFSGKDHSPAKELIRQNKFKAFHGNKEYTQRLK